MRKTILLAATVGFACLTIAAVADPVVIRIAKPDGTYQQFKQDRHFCFRAAQRNRVRDSYGVFFNRDMALHCLDKMGYVHDPRGFVLKLPA